MHKSIAKCSETEAGNKRKPGNFTRHRARITSVRDKAITEV